jgi:hypothetical protein
MSSAHMMTTVDDVVVVMAAIVRLHTMQEDCIAYGEFKCMSQKISAKDYWLAQKSCKNSSSKIKSDFTYLLVLPANKKTGLDLATCFFCICGDKHLLSSACKKRRCADTH